LQKVLPPDECSGLTVLAPAITIRERKRLYGMCAPHGGLEEGWPERQQSGAVGSRTLGKEGDSPAAGQTFADLRVQQQQMAADAPVNEQAFAVLEQPAN
jgi:hypothetical protein